MLLNYITRTWFSHKERFVKAWTIQHLHIGNVVTCRAEGAHYILKKHLEASTRSLHEVKRKICFVVENQFHDVKTPLSTEMVRVPYLYKILFFQNIISHVSHFH